MNAIEKALSKPWVHPVKNGGRVQALYGYPKKYISGQVIGEEIFYQGETKRVLVLIDDEFELSSLFPDRILAFFPHEVETITK